MLLLLVLHFQKISSFFVSIHLSERGSMSRSFSMAN